MGSFNSIVLQGRLAAQPTLAAAGQTNVVNVALAVNSKRKAQDGQYETDWFDLAIWGKQAELVAQHCVKGQEVTIQGSVKLEHFTKRDGTPGSKMKVDVREVSFGQKPREDGQAPQQAPQQTHQPAPAPQQQAYQPQYQQQAPAQSYQQQRPAAQPQQVYAAASYDETDIPF